jgi:DNA-binding transcriptional LysR family regulator
VQSREPESDRADGIQELQTKVARLERAVLSRRDRAGDRCRGCCGTSGTGKGLGLAPFAGHRYEVLPRQEHRSSSADPPTQRATGVAYVRNGLGVALLPRFALGDAENVATLTVDDADLDWPMSLAVSSERTPSAAARAMIAMACESVT